MKREDELFLLPLFDLIVVCTDANRRKGSTLSFFLSFFSSPVANSSMFQVSTAARLKFSRHRRLCVHAHRPSDNAARQTDDVRGEQVET